MSPPLILLAIWVMIASGVAFLPMKYQRLIGLPLLIAALILIIWIARLHGIWWALAGLFAFVSMFRKPLMYFLRKAMGKTT